MSQSTIGAQTSNEYYDLVSIIYHSLNGAQTSAKYAEDASHGGDQELSQFFQQVQQNEIARADRAKQLLVARIIKESRTPS